MQFYFIFAVLSTLFLVDVSDYFYLFFSARGRGRGSPWCQEGAGVGFLLKIPGGGGVLPREGGGGEGAGGCLRGIFGGGELNFFFSGPLDFFGFFPVFMCNLVRRALKSGESSEQSSGENRVKSCHVCGCHGFFRL